MREHRILIGMLLVLLIVFMISNCQQQTNFSVYQATGGVSEGQLVGLKKPGI